MNVKVSRNFMTRDSNSKLIFDTGVVIESTGNSASLPDPMPTLIVLTAARASFITATQDAAHRDIEMVAICRAKRAELVSLFRQLASWVDATADGDLAVLLSSGFPAQTTQRQPVGPLPTPNTPLLRNGPVTGSVTARTSKVNGAYTYNWRAALASAPTVYVRTAQTTGARAIFEGLSGGQTYNVELNAVGTAGASDWSGVSSIMAV